MGSLWNLPECAWPPDDPDLVVGRSWPSWAAPVRSTFWPLLPCRCGSVWLLHGGFCGGDFRFPPPPPQPAAQRPAVPGELLRADAQREPGQPLLQGDGHHRLHPAAGHQDVHGLALQRSGRLRHHPAGHADCGRGHPPPGTHLLLRAGRGHSWPSLGLPSLSQGPSDCRPFSCLPSASTLPPHAN